jgi:DNA-binding MarR family transcriptional regulator
MDLTIPQVRILMLVGSGSALTGGQLAHHLGVKPPTVSAAVDRLVDHGLVARTESDPDRRVKHLELTAEGRTLYDDLVGVRHTSDDIFSELSREDLAALAQGTRALREALERGNQAGQRSH